VQTKIPCVWMRGGTSKGAFFLGSDLPADPAVRDQVLLSVMGSPDSRQIDGMGGADSLTSKVAVVSQSQRPGVDIDFLFIQVVVEEPHTSTLQNCGNMLAGVGPFAVEQGIAQATDPTTTLTVYMENSESIAQVTFSTPGGEVDYEGDARIDGVPGTASPVMTNFPDLAGSTCGALLPTGNIIDVIDGVPVTCIDNGMPVVMFKASDVDRTGYESRDDLNADQELKDRIEAIRLKAGHLMNLGDVTAQTVPKMTLLARPQGDGHVCTRSFIPHTCHAAIGVFAAVSVATGCALEGSPGAEMAVMPEGQPKRFTVEHPTGEFTVEMELGGTPTAPEVKRAALLRTARRLFEGHVLVPTRIWDGGINRIAAE
jgi:4-oxalomesaconate tautomerase